MAEAEAIFIGANRQTHVSDVHPSKRIVAFGAGNTIALWNPLSKSSKGVYSTLKGHTGEITCVKFIEDFNYLVSASEDKNIKIWKFKSSESVYLEYVETFQFHQSSIIAIGVFESFFATGDSTGNIGLWKSNEGKVELVQEFKTKIGVLPLAIAIQEIEPNQYILAIGGSKFNVFIYKFTYSKAGINEFELVAGLEGHEDWVKALAFKKLSDGDFLLASGSQDRYIRLWRIRTNDLIDNSDEDENKLVLLSNKQYKFSIESNKVAINFEALIMGHDDWISALKWHDTQLKLLASSADTALMIWEPDDVSGIWICSSRLGEISTKGASTATGSSGGFWAALWFNDVEANEYILTNGKTGANNFN